MEEYNKAEAYRYYCSTALKCIADNTRAICGGSSPEMTFWDIMHGVQVEKEPELSQEEMIDNITKNAGLNAVD